MPKITLFLMGRKGLNVLCVLIQKGYSEMIDKVILAHDNNVLDDYYKELSETAVRAGIMVFDRMDKVSIDSDYSIAIAWRWILHIPEKCQLVVLHDSLLPKYRGFSPLVNMLINHEPLIGVSAILAGDEFDRGPIITQKSCSVFYPIKISDAIDLISPLYGEIVCDIFEKIRDNGRIGGSIQDETQATYSLWRDEEDYHIDWSLSSKSIQQFIYSVGFPYKGAYSICDGSVVRIFDCKLYEDVEIENRTPGKLLFMIDSCPVIVCGKGLLKLTKLTNDAGEDIFPLKKYRIRLK